MWLLSMGTMPAVLYKNCLHFSRATVLNSLHLLPGAILILVTLQHERWYLYLREILFSIPIYKFRLKPTVVPATKCAIDVFSVISLQFDPQISFLEVSSRLPNTP